MSSRHSDLRGDDDPLTLTGKHLLQAWRGNGSRRAYCRRVTAVASRGMLNNVMPRSCTARESDFDAG